jgi:hypothetical protein
MKIEINRLDQWESTNQNISEFLKIQNPVRCYKGLSHAIYELTTGISQFLEYKNSLTWVKGWSFAFDFVSPYFFKQGFQITPVGSSALADSKNFISGLNKDTLFVLSFANHPITAETIDLAAIDKALNDKKIYHIIVDHHAGSLKTEPSAYTCLINSIDDQLAVAILGSRFKPAVQMAHKMSWEQDQVLALVQKNLNPMISKQTVLDFEGNLPQGFSAFLKTEHRIFDRAVVYSTEANADAMIQWLMAKNKISQTAAVTTSPCHWGLMADYKDWWDGPISEPVLRGMVILDAAALDKIKPQDLQAAAKGIQDL